MGEIELLEMIQSCECAVMYGHYRVVGKLKALQADKMAKDARGQVDKAITGQVQPQQVTQSTPAKRGGQIDDRRVVVESPTEVELPQHTALDSERLRMDDGQLVVAEVQRSEATQTSKCVRLHLRDPGQRKMNNFTLHS